VRESRCLIIAYCAFYVRIFVGQKNTQIRQAHRIKGILLVGLEGRMISRTDKMRRSRLPNALALNGTISVIFGY